MLINSVLASVATMASNGEPKNTQWGLSWDNLNYQIVANEGFQLLYFESLSSHN